MPDDTTPKTDASPASTTPDLPAKPASTTKRDDDVKGGRLGPGTQTEDDVYVG